MNREIKFRGLRKYGSGWAYGNLLNEQTIGEVGENLSHYKYVTVIPEKVGQYTGLKDKNGKEIYEGDILTDKDKNTSLVVWIDEWGMFGCMFQDEWELYRLKGVKEIDESMFWTFPIENNKSEVIGNIHENK